MIKKQKYLYAYVFAFVLPMLCLSLLYYLRGIYPFGNESNLVQDSLIQYHDYFMYFKDVLSGKSGAEYTFFQSAGQSSVALMGYYLFSPFNFLIVFFQKTQIQLFIFVVTALKFGLCGLFFSVFVSRRFSLTPFKVVVLSLAYAFTQYNVGQRPNVMWFDGVYMLPIMLLGVYLYTRENKKTLLYISVALSIILNWYTGYMNCLFINVYYLYESIIAGKGTNFKTQLKKFLGFTLTEILGLFLSCAVFIPVVISQSNGRTVFDKGIFEFHTNGKILDVLRGFVIGSSFPSANITLFCSVLVLTFFFAYWFSKSISTREKIASSVMTVIMVASLFFCPIRHIWNGFKFECGYKYRFVYVAIVAVIIIAASMMERFSCKSSDKSILYGAILFVMVLLLCDWIQSFYAKQLWLTVFIIAVYTTVLYFASAKPRLQTCLTCFTALVFVVEIIINAGMILESSYYTRGLADKTIEYTKNQQQLVDSVKDYDSSFYRMENIGNRGGDPFYANESLAYGYSGIQTYTSSYNAILSKAIVNLGYSNSIFPSFYSVPILPADSFLGVKYIMSEKSYEGFEKTNLPGKNNKSVYLNPYAFPLGFNADSNVLDFQGSDNSFNHVNLIYSSILGKSTKVFKEVTPVYKTESDGIIEMKLPRLENADDMPLYVLINNSDIADMDINLDGEHVATYDNFNWRRSNNRVVYIGTIGKSRDVTFKGCQVELSNFDVHFCYVDMKELSEVTDKIKINSVQNLSVKDGHVTASYTSDNNGTVMFTIPYDEGWKVTVNGKKSEIRKAAESFIAVSVSAGENEIVLHYSAKGKVLGAGLTIFSVLVFVTLYVFEKKKTVAK